MKKIILLLLFTAPALALFAQYKPVESKSSVQFSIKNFGIPVSGNFAGIEGSIVFDPVHPERAVFRMSVKSATVNTRNELRDNHLKKEAYFDAEHFPIISFVSSRTVNSKDGMLVVYGTLTIKNQSKEVAIPFNATATGDGYLFKGQFTINRHDFDVGGSSIISDNAIIMVIVSSVKY